MTTLETLAARSSGFALHLARLRDGRQPNWAVLETPEAERPLVFYVMQRESVAALIAYLDALVDHELIDRESAQRLQSDVSRMAATL